MFDLLQQQDSALFLFINHLPHNLLFDTFFGFTTFIGYFGVVWIIIALYLYIKNKTKSKKLVQAIVISNILAIIIGEGILKNIFARPRPQIDISTAILPFDFYHSFSFPSGHAIIAFAAAFILGRGHERLKWFYYLLAFLIAFSRVYLGKHYPSDILAGAVIGLLIGFSSSKIVTKLA